MVEIKKEKRKKVSEIKLTFDRETGKLLNVRLNGKRLDGTEKEVKTYTTETIKHLSTFDRVQHVPIEFNHKIGKSICTITIGGRTFICC